MKDQEQVRYSIKIPFIIMSYTKNTITNHSQDVSCMIYIKVMLLLKISTIHILAIISMEVLLVIILMMLFMLLVLKVMGLLIIFLYE